MPMLNATVSSHVCGLIAIGCIVSGGCEVRPHSTADVSEVTAEALPQSVSHIRNDSETREVQAESRKPRTNEDPVAVQLRAPRLVHLESEEFEVSVVFDVAPPFEIHSLDAAPPAIATGLELELPPGFYQIEEWTAPPTVRSQAPGGQSVHVGESTFARTIRLGDDLESGDHAVGCKVSYQACNARQCLRPVESQLTISVSVQSR
jgi:hypothetical protein